MNLKRTATLLPKSLQIRFKENRLSICYDVKDDLSSAIISDVWVNFTPSQQLMKLLKKEIDSAIKTADNS